MRVAINGLFWDQPATGSGQYLRGLIEGLAGMDEVEPLLVTAGPPAAPLPAGVEVRPSSRAGGNLAKLWFEQAAFPRASRREEADVVHVPYFAPPLCSGTPAVVTIHDLIPRVLPAYRGGAHVRAYMALVSAAARRAALVVTDSEASARDVERVLGIPRERIRVVYLAAGNAYQPRPQDELVALRRRLGLPERYLLYLGGFDRRKRVPELLQALKLSLARLEPISLVVAGGLPAMDSAFAPDPRRVAQELDLGDHVRFVGYVEEADKPALYAGAEVFVFPSIYEGFGLPPLEALSCGTPVIAAQSSSLPEVVGEAGLLVEPDDVEALAEAICAVMGDSDLRDRLAAKAIEQAAQFSWQRAAAETVAAYREAAASGRQ
ncbi:MAG: glycosyltransferase family 4 protein [Anaerolineae bacterium]|jgi:glycosyltransferase involved in cell wall biosynthesis